LKEQARKGEKDDQRLEDQGSARPQQDL